MSRKTSAVQIPSTVTKESPENLAEETPARHTLDMHRRTSGRLPLLLSAGIALLLAGCAGDAELDTLEPAGPDAEYIDNLVDPLFLASFAVFFLILALSVGVAIKNRVKGDYEEGDWPKQIHGNDKLEWAWTALPALVMATISVFTVIAVINLNDEEANAYSVSVDGDTVQWEPHVVVVGHQWWWEYRYYFDGFDVDAFLDEDHANPAKHLPPADIVTSGQMIIPAGQEIELSITSRDVIHSHWIPALNGKRDAVPGRIHPWKLEADAPGYYFGQCTEFCGLSHARMRMQTIAMNDADFAQWVEQQMTPTTLADGDAAFIAALRAGENPAPANSVQQGLVNIRQLCSACHLVEGVNHFDDVPEDSVDNIYKEENVGISLTAGAAPNLTHFASRSTFAGAIFNLYNEDGSLNRNKLEAWLRNPAALKANAADNMQGMPNLNLTEDQIDDIVAALETFGTRPSASVIAETFAE